MSDEPAQMCVPFVQLTFTFKVCIFSNNAKHYA